MSETIPASRFRCVGHKCLDWPKYIVRPYPGCVLFVCKRHSEMLMSYYKCQLETIPELVHVPAGYEIIHRTGTKAVPKPMVGFKKIDYKPQ